MTLLKVAFIETLLSLAQASRLSSLARSECDYAVELLCLQDGSSSFLSHVEQWAATSNELLTRLSAEYKDIKVAISSFTDKPIPFSGYGMYGGYELYAQDYCYMNHVPLTTSAQAVADALADLQVFMAAGFDEREAQAEAMLYAALDPYLGWSLPNQTYTEDGRPIARVMLLITDAPSHEAGNAKSNLASWNTPRSYPDGYDQPSVGGFGSHAFITSPTLAVDEELYYEMADLYALRDAYEAGVGRPLDADEESRLQELVDMYGPEQFPDPLDHPGDDSIPDCTKTEYPTLQQMITTLKERDILPIFLSSTSRAHDFYAWYQTNVFEPMGILTITAMFDSDHLFDDIMTAIDTLLAQKCLWPTEEPLSTTKSSPLASSEAFDQPEVPDRPSSWTTSTSTTSTVESLTEQDEETTETFVVCTSKPPTTEVPEEETIETFAVDTSKPPTTEVPEEETTETFAVDTSKPPTTEVPEEETTETLVVCTSKPPTTEVPDAGSAADYTDDATLPSEGSIGTDDGAKVSTDLLDEVTTTSVALSLMTEDLSSEVDISLKSTMRGTGEPPSFSEILETEFVIVDTAAEALETELIIVDTTAEVAETEFVILDPTPEALETELVILDPTPEALETELIIVDTTAAPAISKTGDDSEAVILPPPIPETPSDNSWEPTNEVEYNETEATEAASKVGVIVGATAGATAGAAAVAVLVYKQLGAGLFGHTTPQLGNVEQMATAETPVERETMQEVTMDLFQ